MVKAFFLTLIISLFPFMHLKGEIVVDASVEAGDHPIHFPIPVSITITHSEEDTIDPHSFKLENKPLEVYFVKNVKMSSTGKTLISIYHFELPGKNKGLYVLPSISVKIGNKNYYSIPSTFSVAESAQSYTSTQPPQSAQKDEPLIFKLEAFVEGPTILYPGERTKLFYRISYNRDVDLTKSELPMIHPQHFQKVGDVRIRDVQLKNMTAQELTQEIEAAEPGTFTFGPSLIEGYAYTINKGKKVYDSTLLRSSAPIVTIEVKPFPQSSQPLSFTGGIGKIQLDAHLETSLDALVVGDHLKLLVSVSGLTNLDAIHFPHLECQPGFSGFFKIHSFPPLAEKKGKTKVFEIEMRPLTALTTQIPSIELSSFDPKKGEYVIQHTKPIPIEIKRKTLESVSIASIPSLLPLSIPKQWPKPVFSPISTDLQSDESLNNLFSLNRKVVLVLFCMGGLLILLQIQLKKWRNRHPGKMILSSEILYKQALKEENFRLLEQAFWHRLWEQKQIPWGSYQVIKMSHESKLNQVLDLIYRLQAFQYGLEKNLSFKEIKNLAGKLF